MFGLSQLADLMNPNSKSQSAQGAAGAFEAVAQAMVSQLEGSFRSTYDLGERVQSQMFGAVVREDVNQREGNQNHLQAIFQASSIANEEVLLCYTKGDASFSPDNRYVAVSNQVFGMDGSKHGRHQGVWEALFRSPGELFRRPNPPSYPLNEPLGPVQKGIVTGQTKAKWEFCDGTIVAAGPLTSHLIKLADGATLFLISAAQVVTGGDGRFSGCFGLTQSLGSAYVPAGVNPFASNASLAVTTIDTFKIRVVRSGSNSFATKTMHSYAQPNPIPSTSNPQTIPSANRELFSAKSRANEEVLLCTTEGTANFTPDSKFVSLNAGISLMDGRGFGEHHCVWEKLFANPKDLFARPDPPTQPLNEPVGPVQKGIVSANSKAKWSFNDGEIYAAGPITANLIPLADGSQTVMVSAALVITGGTGRFNGAYGLVQSLGSARFSSGETLGNSGTIKVKTIDTFKIRRVNSTAVPSRPKPSVGTGKFINVLGSYIHFIEEGKGETVLFLHGNPTSSYLWRNIIPGVSKVAHCVAPDLIGMGKSDKPDIEYRFFDHVKYLDEFIKSKNLKNIHLVLHDWGCMFGFFYAMRNAENVSSLVFMEAMFRPYRHWREFPAPLRETFQAFRAPNIGYERVVVDNEWLTQLLPGSMMKKLSAEEFAPYLSPFKNPKDRKPIWKLANELPIEGHPSDVTAAVRDYSRWLKETSIPKLLMYANPGAITTKKDVSWAKSNLKNLTTVDIGSGIHFHQEDEPENITQTLCDWLVKSSSPNRKAAKC